MSHNGWNTHVMGMSQNLLCLLLTITIHHSLNNIYSNDTRKTFLVLRISKQSLFKLVLVFLEHPFFVFSLFPQKRVGFNIPSVQFVLNTLVLCWKFNPHNGSERFEELNDFILSHSLRKVSHNDSPVIKYFTFLVIQSPQFNQFVFDPIIPQLTLD